MDGTQLNDTAGTRKLSRISVLLLVQSGNGMGKQNSSTDRPPLWRATWQHR
jgi:hypothetical protein